MSPKDLPSQISSRDALTSARHALKESLRPFFKGKNAEQRLEDAALAALQSIDHLITTQPEASNRKLGATVMTESASANKRVAPRNI